MMRQEHLQKSDITLFRQGGLSANESLDAARHLLQCSNCRYLLPKPQTKGFVDCLFRPENQVIELRASNPWFSIAKTLSFRTAILAGFLVLITATLSGLFLVRQYSIDDSTLAKDEIHPEQLSSFPGDFARSTVRESDQNTNNSRTNIEQESGRRSASVRSGKVKRPALTETNSLPRLRRSETRGSERVCPGGLALNLESITSSTEVVLRWNRIKDAATYSVYISDLEENLIDHYETPDQLSYKTGATLNSDATYRWKLIVTLGNGNTIVGPSQRFTIDSSNRAQQKQTPLSERRKSTVSVRCVENK